MMRGSFWILACALGLPACAQATETPLPDPKSDSLVITRHTTGKSDSSYSNSTDTSIVASNVTLSKLIQNTYHAKSCAPILGISDAELDERYDIGGGVERPDSEIYGPGHRSAYMYMMEILLQRHLGIIVRAEKRKLDDKEIEVLVVSKVPGFQPAY